MSKACLLISLLAAAACGGKSVPPAPQPFRPEVVEVPPPPDPRPQNPDCGAAAELQVTPFDDREIPAAESLAKQGDEKLVAARADAATLGDLAPFERLSTVVTHPFEPTPGDERYAHPAPESFGRYFQTFCGT